MTRQIVSPARRAPVQRRSALRVEAMLDAAAALLDDDGPDALTTSGIARRAGVSVGSLYQFFPDKHAVVEALARRSFVRFSTKLATIRGLGWEQTVDAVIDAYVDFSRSEPAFLVLSFGGPISVHMLDPQDDNNAVVARALGGLFDDIELSEDVRRLAVEVGDAILALAFRRNPQGDAALVAEAKTAVKAYLAAKLT